MNYLKLFIIGALLCLVCPNTFAQNRTHRFSHTKVAAEALTGLNLQALPADSSVVVNTNGIKVVVRKNEMGEVEHIGRKLFPLNIRQIHPSPVYDYLEYAYLNSTLQFIENPFIYKDFNFMVGSWKKLEGVTDETLFGISVENRTHYRVSWQLAAGDVEVIFPIDYDKLTMEPRRDVEDDMILSLKRFKATGKVSLPKVDKSALTQVPESSLMIIPGEMYLKKEVTRNLYIDNSTGTPNWVWSREHPGESLANLLLTGSAFDADARIAVTFLKYENKKETVEMPLRAFLEYFQKQGCVLYWGTEQVTNTEVVGSLFIYNSPFGYDHVVKITCPIQHIGKTKGKITGVANLFIPTTRVRDLFYQYSPRAPRKINYE